MDRGKGIVLKRLLRGVDATEALARALAAEARPGDCIALSGKPGAGKTVFARAFIRALAGEEISVPSPTFMLVQQYEGRLADGEPVAVSHWDLYRIKAGEELAELGMDEEMASGVTLVEWPEIAFNVLPETRLDMQLADGESETERHLACSGNARWRERLEGIP